MSYRSARYVSSPCSCKGPERVLNYPLDFQNNTDKRFEDLVNSYLNDRFNSVRSKAKEYSFVGWSMITAFSVFGGPTLMAATAVVATPIALFCYGFVYLTERPRQWDRDLALFLAHEYITNHPNSKDDEILEYINSERYKFYQVQCSYCEDILD